MDAGGLVRAAAGGDTTAWTSLVDRYAGLVWSVARSHRLDPGDAADVSQTTWLRLVENLDRIRDPDKVGAWLATTARRESYRLLRQSGRTVPTDEIDLEAATNASVPTVGVLTSERDAALLRAFQRVTGRCRQLLRLLFAEPSPSYEEIGAAMAMPVGSIGPTRARCLGKLRDELATEGISGADAASIG